MSEFDLCPLTRDYLITLSARASTLGGIVTPSNRAATVSKYSSLRRVCNARRAARLQSNPIRHKPPGFMPVRPLPPIRHVAAVATVELLGNVVVTSWAATPIVRFGSHVRPSFQIWFACVIRSNHCEVGNLGNNTLGARLVDLFTSATHGNGQTYKASAEH